MPKELIIGLTEHRQFGHVFQAFLIRKQVSFYSIEKLVKQRDISSLELNEEQTQLVKLTEQYSDEMLVRKFSKKKEAGKFFQQMKPELFETHIGPYIDKHMSQIVRILMHGHTRLFLKQAKYSNLYEEDRIDLPAGYAGCTFCFDHDNNGTRYHLELCSQGKTFSLQNRKIILVTSQPCALIWQHKMLAFEKIHAKRLLPFTHKDFIFIPSQMEDQYYSGFVLQTIRDYPVKVKGFTVREEEPEPQAVLSMEQNLRLEPALYPRFAYGSQEFPADSKTPVTVCLHREENNYFFRKIKRNFYLENYFLEQLRQSELIEENGTFLVRDQQGDEPESRLYKLLDWLCRNQNSLEQQGFQIRQDKLSKRYVLGTPTLRMEIQEKEDWFDLHILVHFGDYRIPFVRLKKYILGGIREFELPSGEFALIPEEWFTDYRDLLPLSRQEGNKLKLGRHHFRLLPNHINGLNRKLAEQLEALGNKRPRKVKIPENLQASLRSYQQEGVSWICHLQQNRFGGCLADDMGLGKTLQTLTVLLCLQRPKTSFSTPVFEEYSGQLNLFGSPAENLSGRQPASLIVMPTSLVHNWENEIRKFTPSMKVYRHTGLQRKRTGTFKRITEYYDIILTTYGTVRNDIEMLREQKFFYLILDESQHIKNPGSKTYQSVSQLKSSHRLVLTGTPIENSLSDLWAQMNFINKGLLGSLAYFKREFLHPIEKKNDTDKQDRLQLLIHPFILRRTKEQVARDLPPVTEQIRYCSMDKTQQKIYEKEKSAIRNSILKNIEQEGPAKSAFIILQGLTRLRLLANHPSLVSGTDD
ncbi:MAG: DEAD/DEAH box helicase, partial [Mangrovibacterium sp.]